MLTANSYYAIDSLSSPLPSCQVPIILSFKVGCSFVQGSDNACMSVHSSLQLVVAAATETVMLELVDTAETETALLLPAAVATERAALVLV